jgi:hypothetical protein
MSPGQEIIREIVVTVPEGTPPGEYTTSVVIQNLEPIGTTESGGFGILQVIRQAVAVAVTVPGPAAPELAVDAASYLLVPAYAAVMVSVENTGNIRLAPVATMILTDANGEEVTRATRQMDTFFPGTRTDLEFQLVRTLEPGEYQVTVSLEDTEHQVSAGPVDLTMTIEAPAGTPIAETSINIASVGLTEGRNADGELQVVEVVVAIDNPGMQASNARLTLHVTRDGEPVEDLELGSSLTFPAGPAEFKHSVTLESIDPNTNQPVELDEAEADVTVTVK